MGVYGDKFHVVMTPNKVMGTGGGTLLTFRFNLYIWDQELSRYNLVTQYTSWLEMDGHALLLSPSHDGHSHIGWNHLHTRKLPGSGDLKFNLFTRKPEQFESLRIWFTVKPTSEGKVLSFPFTI